MWNHFLAHTLACIGNINEELLILTPCRHVYLSIFWRELEGIGKQIVHNLDHIVGYKIHKDFAFGEELEVDVTTASIAMIAFYNHGEVCYNITILPIGIAHSRFYFRYIQELVDEHEEPVSLPFYGLRLSLYLFFIRGLQFMAQAKNNGKWRSELVGNIGEKVLSQSRHSFQRPMVALAQSVGIKHHCQYSCQTEQHNSKNNISDVACGAFLFQSVAGFVHLPFLPVAFYFQTCILNTVHFLHIQYAVLHCRCFLVRSQCRTAIALLLVVLII